MAEVMFWTIGVFIALIVIAGLGIGIFLIARKFKSEKIPVNAPFVVIFPTKHSGGCAIGLETATAISEVDSCIVNKVLPRDVGYDSNGYPQELPEVSVAVQRSHRISIPKGVLSAHREIVFYLPNNAGEMPFAFQQTMFGRVMMATVEALNIYDDALTAIRAGNVARTQIIESIQTGELSKHALKHFASITEELIDKPLRKEAERQGALPPPPQR